MNYLIALLIILSVSFLHKWSQSSSHFQSAKELQKKFDNWLSTKSDSDKPSNGQLEKLFMIKTNEKKLILPYGHKLENKQVDIIFNFPVNFTELNSIQKKLLSNLVEYFEILYNETFSIAFWINYMIFLPQKFIKYMGFKESDLSAKLSNVLYWLLTLIIILWKPFFFDLFHIVFNPINGK